MAKIPWGAETFLFLCFLPGLLWIGQKQFLFDPGSFWSTVVGQRIAETGEVPRQDEFSCTFQGRPWQSHQWLAQLGMAGLHGVGGLDGLVLGAAALLAATYAWAVGRLIRSGCPWIIAAFVIVLVYLGSRYHWLARPQLFTIPLLAWTFAQLVDMEAGRISWRRWYFLPPVFVVWSNLHGGALGGLCTLAFVLAGWYLARLLGRQSPLAHAAVARRVYLVGVACVLATLVNPYGWDLPLGWFRLMQLLTLPKYIYEHMPLDWTNPYQRGILIFGLVYVLVLATVPPVRWRVTWFVPLIWFVLTLQRVRHCTLFSITAVVALADMLAHSRFADWSRQTGREQNESEAGDGRARVGQGPDGSASTWLIPVLVVATALILQRWGIPVPLVGAGQARIDPALVPKDLVGAIRERSQPNEPIFNEMAYGGFLIYYVPEVRVYIDDRCELYGDEFIAEQQDLAAFFDRLRRERKDPGAHDQLDRWADAKGIRLALVMKSRGFDYYLGNVPERWTPVAETVGEFSPASVPGAVLYERKRP